MMIAVNVDDLHNLLIAAHAGHKWCTWLNTDIRFYKSKVLIKDDSLLHDILMIETAFSSFDHDLLTCPPYLSVKSSYDHDFILSPDGSVVEKEVIHEH